MSAAFPIEPRPPAPADGLFDLSEPTSRGRRLRRRLAGVVYGLLWIAAALLWTAPLSAIGSETVGNAFNGRETFGAWFGAALAAGPAVFGAIWASIRTARSRLAHRRMLLWGGIAAALLAGGALYWHREQQIAREIDSEMLAGLLEFLLAALCGVTAGGSAALFLAGAWGRWVLHRRPDEPAGQG
ncbi:hypothetical protein [Alienimonas californiensis]|uniref:Uncharacterized protein n=1 Tax=Alienimonas californiensis TaxID=2527989 RepID=A0A517P585_9PLAN|nr:hypothetical protein [Alienimonas californiensis]QDT14548.1 hypothetical protein CA12_06230 [Alienimonas californiensis]